MDQSEKIHSQLCGWGRSYSEKKKKFEEYLSLRVHSINYMIDELPMQLIMRNDLRIEITYCDHLFLLDFTLQKDNKDIFAICGQAYKMEYSLGLPSEKPMFLPVGDNIYLDRDYIYKLDNGKFEFVQDTAFNSYWLEDFILATLQHTFD